MPHLNLLDVARRPMAKKGFVPRNKFKPGGTPGKLHREMGIAEGEKIPETKLEAATHSDNPEKRRDAIRAETMSHWKKGGKHKSKGSVLYDRKKAG